MVQNMKFAEELQYSQENTQTYAEETKELKENFSEELIKIKHIEGTPFTLINTEMGWFIAMGQARLTEYEETKERLEKMIEEKDWGLMVSFAARIVDIALKEHKLINN